MSKIAIVTDTNSCIPQDISKEKNIRQVPIGIHFGEELFDSVFGITDKVLFERIDKENKLPTTSAPSIGKWVDTFKETFEEGADEIVCFCCSSAVSGTYGSAVNAAEMLEDKKITVVDTESLSMGEGFMVLAAAEEAEKGSSTEKIIEKAFDVQKRTKLFGALATLKYLAMSGRVGNLAAGFANLLNVKPILTIQNGKLDMLEKIRTQKKTRIRMIELSTEALQGREIERFALLHVDAGETAQEFGKQFAEEIAIPQETLLCDLTPGLSVHTGTGLIGVCFVMK